ncbi:phosphoribosylanthranilate isomerase [Thermomicrobium sp. 4228-Ro]|uniref:phosphoribosylanthranilate isomerase n=1 Tax=Thermomicrobium sp. 4228-Ro TaxID=2993937 RepID=UPI0022495D16|nr:phosphoribosylanthranilate isomerase [Thermomicrobium sp. 4228-Ro]MCX2726737.1 phosphoribosylanthranilate isomerase [Thermomicrobium sp. 4228-Ro]
MPGIVKLCGMRTPEDALAAAEAGADFIGLVFAPSPRRVTLEEAAVICRVVRAVSQPPRIVGLFVDAPVEEIQQVAVLLQLDAVQLHGSEPPEVVRVLGWPVLKAIRVRVGETVEAVRQRVASYFAGEPTPYAVVLDTYHPRMAGGTGETFDWSVAAAIAREFPVILAGGLRAENVAEAIAAVRPFGVDVSSGIEVVGKKDPDRMHAFVAAARTAFARLFETARTESGGTR